jgi:hypothetical protein
MTAQIIPFRRPTADPPPIVRTLKDTILDSRVCSDYRTAMMLVAEAVGRSVSLIQELETLSPAEAEAALGLVRRFYPDRSARLARHIVERRQRA